MVGSISISAFKIIPELCWGIENIKTHCNFSNMSDIDDETRSTDGSDSEGSLVDFIVKDGTDEEDFSEEEEEEEEGDEANALLKSLTEEERRLLEQSENTEGPRRSSRNRKAVTRYVDDNYGKLFYDDVDVDKLASSDDDINAERDSDDEFHVSGDSSTDDEEEEEDEEDDEKEKAPPAKKKRRVELATNKKSV